MKTTTLRKTPLQFYLYWAMTLWLVFFFAATGTKVANAAIDNVPAPNGMTSNQTACVLYVVAVVVVVGIVVYVVYKIIGCINHIFGSSTNSPPDDPTSPNIKTSGTTAKTLQTTSFSAADLNTNNPMGFLSGLFGPVGSPQAPGTLPDGIGTWAYVGTHFDPAHQIDYSGGTIINFSLLSSPDMINWTTVSTTVGWTGSDASHNPWVCQVVYSNPPTLGDTNGIPISTNWFEMQLGGKGELTNLVVFGPAPVTATNGLTQPKLFYRLSCNSNTVSTVGP